MAKKKSKKTIAETVDQVTELSDTSEVSNELLTAFIDTYIIDMAAESKVDVGEEMEELLKTRLGYLMRKVEGISVPYTVMDLPTDARIDGDNILDIVGWLVDGQAHTSILFSNTDALDGRIQLGLNKHLPFEIARVGKKLMTDTASFKTGTRQFKVNPYSVVNWLTHMHNTFQIERFVIVKGRRDMDVLVNGAHMTDWSVPTFDTWHQTPVNSDKQYAILNDFSYKYLKMLLSTGSMIRDVEFTSLLGILLDAYDNTTLSINPGLAQKYNYIWHKVPRVRQPDYVSNVKQYLTKAELIRTISIWGPKLIGGDELTIKPYGRIWELNLNSPEAYQIWKEKEN